MCGRYVIDSDLADLQAAYEAEISDLGYWDYEANFNVCPTDTVPVIAFDGQKRRKLVPMRWGLHPHWSKTGPTETKFAPLFNARIETAAEKPSFRTPWRRRRCLIPATHWYEWTGEQGGKVPWCIRPETDGLFAFAGLWDMWRVDEGITLLSCTILTTDADGPTDQLHPRMPVRLPETLMDAWLDPDQDPQSVMNQRLSGEDLIFWEVDRAVNSNRAEGDALIAPLV